MQAYMLCYYIIIINFIKYLNNYLLFYITKSYNLVLIVKCIYNLFNKNRF